MSKKINYQTSWENDFHWLQKSKLNGYATCIICKKDNIYFGSMGRSAIKSHEQGKKHKEQEKNAKLCPPIKTWFASSQQTQQAIPQQQAFSAVTQDIGVHPLPGTSKDDPFLVLTHTPSTLTTTPTLCESPSDLPTQAPSKSTEIREKWWLAKDNVTKAEILWCLHTVMTHQSLRNAEAAVSLFKTMFPDCNVATEMKLGKDKTSYSIVYGLAPYFRNNLLNKIESSDFYIVGFDESMNKFSQQQQLDIVIRFWDKSTDQVSSRYISSVFLSETKAVNLLSALKDGLVGLDWRKIIQVSMDGPNVNLKLLRLLKKEIEEESNDSHKLLDLGSCGLHVLNVAFKTGFKTSGWELIEFLRGAYYLFKDSPSRRGIYIKVTKSSRFPLKFCSVRWLENAPVGKRAIEILDNLKTYVDHVKNDKTLKTTQNSKSFKVVQRCLDDKLLPVKLSFFVSFAEDIEPFLRKFQSDKPLVPFLYEELQAILRCSMERVVKEEVMMNQPLKNIDIQVEENLKPAKCIDLGYAAKSALRKCNDIKDLDILKFKKECKRCLVSFLSKLVEKSPLKYELTQAVTFLNPKEIREENKKVATKNMTKALEILEDSNLITATWAQKADREYRAAIDDVTVIHECKAYTSESRLDTFWSKLLEKKKGEHLKEVVKILLPLSHGNATLERGFSVNGDLVVENLSEQSLIAQRLVYDSILSCGGVSKLIISKEMILSVRNSNQRWKEALKLKKEKLDEKTRAKAEKRKLTALTKELEEKKRKLVTETAKDVAKIEQQITDLKRNLV